MESLVETPSQPHATISLIVIGASAGGIEALSAVLTALPAHFPCPIVIAQHLDPARSSHLEEILARKCLLPVRTVIDQERLLPGVVYVVPADRDVELGDNILYLRQHARHYPKPSVNLLLSSAARAFGERLIAVILSGTGSDGTAGALAVKSSGGMVIIQNPETATFPGMPASLASATVDIVADLAQIGPLLIELVTHTDLPALAPSADGDTSLDTLLEDVRQHSGIDFGHYKTPTILRRIQRRMVVVDKQHFSDYKQYLVQHPEEYQRLVASFLINVTEFFRDPELFAALREQIIPDLVAQARLRGNELRVWSAGCATGEEAYSLAILIAECLGNELSHFTVQIFATDLDGAAIAFARRGLYSTAAVAAVADDLRARYFTQVDGGYEVIQQIRGLLVFGEHDLGQRAPLPRISLVVCRNVLMYFSSDLQRHALELFAYSLQDGGFLVVGNAETANLLADSFAPAHPRLKIYRREGVRLMVSPLRTKPRVAPRFLPLSRYVRDVRTPNLPAVNHDLPLVELRARTSLEQLGQLILGLSIGVVVVDRRYDVHAINGVAHRLLDIFRPAAGEDIIHLAERVPSAPLRSIIDAAFRAVASASTAADLSSADLQTIVTFETLAGQRRDLQLVACIQSNPLSATARTPEASDHPVETDSPDTGLRTEALGLTGNASVVLLVTDISRHLKDLSSHEPPPRARQRKASADETELVNVRAELERMTTRNHLLVAAAEELTDANVRLQHTFDSLQVNHEDAQAAMEEVRTYNEEMQATNEELETLNEEMEATVEELRTANDDLQARTAELQRMAQALSEQRQVSEEERARLTAVLSSMNDAVLVVDDAGQTLRTNAAYDRMFGAAAFVPQDEFGKDLLPEASYQLRAACGETFSMQFTLPADPDTPPGALMQRRVFDVAGAPIVGEGQVGGVIVIRDVSERSLHRLQDQFIGLANHELRTPLTSLKGYMQLAEKHLPSNGAQDRVLNHSVMGALAQVQRLQRLVDDLLDVRRLQNDKFSLQLDRVDCKAIVTQAVDAVRMIAPQQTFTVAIEDSPLVVWGDAHRLEQVVTNLLTNALSHAPASAQIVVRQRRVESDVELQVQDFGPGIPASELPHLFSRFYQVGVRGRQGTTRGLGLGLYIADQIVRGHGGQLTVASEVGKGSTFSLRIPLLKGHEQ